ncbi:MAG: threonine synthase [Candidatus Sifarchaeia archaeon]|jgi:threonine synthase
MQFYSTKNKNYLVSLKDAVLKGLPTDGGLYMPVVIPKQRQDFLDNLWSQSFQEIAFNVSTSLIGNSLPNQVLKIIIDDAFNFDAPLVQLEERLCVLELFHGPTLAFKDFAARFMARLLAYFVKDSNRELTILTATSGDTGSAVAHGFHNINGIRVILLYPSKMVSTLQEKQFTTIKGNITALEIKGTFDDCQKLVKQALLDTEISAMLNLTSANSINVARLIPQCMYYFYAYSQLLDKKTPFIISVPCGNFGNLTAGLMSKKIGLPVSKFVAAVNKNDSFVKYLNTGVFSPQTTQITISSAMDVGNPSNFFRILDFYNNKVRAIRQDVSGFSYSDNDTKEAIKKVYKKYKYILDPHGAIGYLGQRDYMKNHSQNVQGIFLETAHPAKFIDIVQQLVPEKIKIPARLSNCMEKEKTSILLSKDYSEFKQYLRSLI